MYVVHATPTDATAKLTGCHPADTPFATRYHDVTLPDRDLTPDDFDAVDRLPGLRRLMLDGARALLAGVEPAAAANGAAYTVRSGSAVVDGDVAFADVMTERFGDVLGRVPDRAASHPGGG